MRGLVFDIQHFSIYDGPGIRTTVFMKGCTLDCDWCHNPESISSKKEIQTYFFKCIGCGKCFEVCPEGAHSIIDGARDYNKDICIRCGTCTENCYSGALVMTGKEMTVEQVVDEVLRDAAFYKTSGGGVTFSGGEPLLQDDFIASALERFRQAGIHTAVDTAGNVPYKAFGKVLPFTDLFLYDIKSIDETTHKKHTKAGNKIILSNLQRLGDTGKPIRIRVPIIPGVNAGVDSITRISDFLATVDNIEAVEPLAYHSLGAGKFESMGKTGEEKVFDVPEKSLMIEIYNLFEKAGFKVIRKSI